jgi:alkylation response protein AidB-like acyl-CoA dehydrogenase
MTAEVAVDTTEQATLRARARAFLGAHCRKRVDMVETPMLDDRHVAQAFQKALFEAGLAGLTVPRDYGGQGLGAREQEIFNEEALEYYLPIGVFTITLGMCVPVLLELGTEEQKRRHIEPMLEGREIWCQMFSEPGAGSDLASLQTKALRDGDEWTLDGQKVWTSGAHYASFGLCLARTDPDAPKHRGLSMFIVPMGSAGITVRPLVQATGDAGFNEVFCDGVRLPADAIIGAPGDGWRGALATLMNERVALGASGNSLTSGRADVLVAAAKALGATADPNTRQALVDVWIREEVLRYLGLRVRAATQAGRTPGPEGSVAKLAGGELVRRAASLHVHLLGAAAMAWPTTDADVAKAVRTFVHAPSFSIAGGSSEIQRNILGERVLGLPKDAEVDRGVPFRDLKVGTQR